MQDAIIYLDAGSGMSLQNQIRQKLVDGILNGSFPPGMKLPSSRKLAQQLEVARNTVVAAYQQLIADGYLVSRQRSGIFVNEEILSTCVGHSEGSRAAQAESAAWARRVRSLPARWREAHDQPIVGQRAASATFPVASAISRSAIKRARFFGVARFSGTRITICAGLRSTS